MKSLMAKNDFERSGLTTIETQRYFFQFKKTETEIHFIQMYIDEPFRGYSTFKDMYLHMREFVTPEIKYVVATVVPKTPHAENALKCLLKVGMKLLKSDNEKIWLYEEVKHG